MLSATEGSHTIDGQYLRSRTLARKSQLPTGASHFAHPNQGTGRQQAEWFVAHGGGWKPDGKTLPGTLDLSSGEPHGFGECWDMYDLQMQNWVEDFVDEYHDLTGMWPMIRVTSTWWYRCMMNTRSLRDKCPLVLAGHVQTKEERKNKKVEALPTAWGRVAMSQEPDVEISLSRATVLRTDKKSLRKLLKGKQ
ncbi:hypothetical protein KEM55_002745 [Ascosphaera atra]|nr:hypothetical protein KEM55_002745 [Ascosphaera atra]